MRAQPFRAYSPARGTIEPDPEHSGHMHAYRCESAYVLLVDHIPAISAEVAAAGWKREPTESLPTYVVKNLRPPGAPD